MPARVGHGHGPRRPQRFFNARIAWSTPPSVSGITKDSGGVALGSCIVKLYLTATDALIATTISDAVTGAYAFYQSTTVGPCYVVAYKAGAPDVAGTTVNTLVSA